MWVRIFINLSILFSVIFIVSCAKKDLQYYKMKPEEIQAAVEQCANQSSNFCDELVKIQAVVSQLVTSLSMDQQGFGKQILSLQEQIGNQKAALKTNPQQNELLHALQVNQQKLAEYLAVVRWKEAPEH